MLPIFVQPLKKSIDYREWIKEIDSQSKGDLANLVISYYLAGAGENRSSGSR